MAETKDKTKSRKRRGSMIAQLEDLIKHPNTSPEERAAAQARLDEMRAKMSERAEHTEKVREQAREDMSTAEGMRRVVEFMRNSPNFAQHSPNNIALLLADADMRGMKLTSVRKLSEWRSMGYKVVKGERAFVQWVPMRPKEDDEDQRMRFRLVAAWFDRSQVEPLKKSADPTPSPEQTTPPGPFALPAEPETGDRHAWLWLVAQAERDGLEVLVIHDVDVPAAVTFHEAEKRIGVTIPPGPEGFPDYGSVAHDLAAILFARIKDRDARREAPADSEPGAEPKGKAKAGKTKTGAERDTPLFDVNW
jgi:hypothetical protein